MTDQEIYDLLLQCGFKGVTRGGRPPTGFRWAVVGELEGGFRLPVQCMTGARGGYVLLVPSEGMKQLLVEILLQNGAGVVDVRAEQMERGPWLPLTVGAGALALFTWVLTSIGPTMPR